MDKPGIYLARFHSGVTTEASTGTPQLALKFEVSHIAENGAWIELQESMDRTVFLSLTDAAWPFAKKKLERSNFNGDFSNPQLTLPDGCELTCTEDSYQGRTRSRWDIPLGDVEQKPASADVVRRLAAQWKSMQARPAPTARPAPALKKSLSIAADFDARLTAILTTGNTPDQADTLKAFDRDLTAAQGQMSQAEFQKLSAALEHAKDEIPF